MRSKFKWIFALLLAFSVQVTFAQEKTVTGTVKDATGFLANASVTVKGSTTRGTQTDFDGNYSIKVSQGESLVFTYAGMESQTKVVGAESKIDVVLAEQTLETVVINTGYRQISATKSTMATSEVKAAVLEDRANGNAIQNLQGMVAGLNISTGTGQPGANPTIVLRGIGTISSDFEPLFIVDGIAVDGAFRTINPADIEKFEILKDATATAIYGNRGSNGVIVITTKKAKFGESLSVRYQGSYGITELQGLNIPLMNSRQMLNFEKQYGEGYGATLSDAEIDAIAKQTNTRWTDFLFRKGTSMSHNVTLSSGTERTSNLTSIGYFDQEGIFLSTSLKRFSVRNNFTGKSANDKFNYAMNISLNFSKQQGMDGAGSNAIYFAPFSAALRGLPYLSAYDADGSVTTDGGIITRDPDTGAVISSGITPDKIPYVLLNGAKMNLDREDEFKLLTNFSASYKVTNDLTAKFTAGGDFSQFTAHEILHPNSILGPFQTSATLPFGGIDSQSSSRNFRFNSVTSLNFLKSFGKHTIDATAYTEYFKNHYTDLSYAKRGIDPRLVGTGASFITPGANPAIVQYIPTIGANIVNRGLFSYFGDFQYDYDNKYVVTATIRRDASDRFIEENKWATFWSIGGAWNLDKEKFLENTKVSQLKLRLSYGTTGNQEFTALVRDLFTNGGGYNGQPATYPRDNANPTLQWEVTKTTNFGLDFGFWKNKLSGAVEVYRKFTDELFNNGPVSNINGTDEVQYNVGAMQNKGVELTLNYRIFTNKDWNISANVNGSYNKNEMVRLDPSYEGIYAPGGATALIEGEPVNVFYVSHYVGVNPSNGNPLFLDANGNLTESLVDADRKSTGKSVFPVWQGGFSTNVGYKGFELTTQWSWMKDLWRNNLDLGTVEETNVIADGGNRATTVLNAWQNPGDITTIPRAFGALNSIDFINGSDRYLQDASFLRLRNVSLGYNFNKQMLDKTPFSALRFYIQAENIVTFTKYQGWDAEAGFRGTDRGNYPTPKIYTFGVSVNF